MHISPVAYSIVMLIRGNAEVIWLQKNLCRQLLIDRIFQVCSEVENHILSLDHYAALPNSQLIVSRSRFLSATLPNASLASMERLLAMDNRASDRVLDRQRELPAEFLKPHLA